MERGEGRNDRTALDMRRLDDEMRFDVRRDDGMVEIRENFDCYASLLILFITRDPCAYQPCNVGETFVVECPPGCAVRAGMVIGGGTVDNPFMGRRTRERRRHC